MSLSEIKSAVDKIGENFDEFKKQADARLKRIDGRNEVCMEVFEGMKKALGAGGSIDLPSLVDRVEEMEARANTPGKPRSGVKSLAAEIQEHDSFKQCVEGRSSQVSFEIKGRSLLREYKDALTTNLNTGSPSSTIPVQAVRIGGMANDPRRAIRILDVLPHQPLTETNAFEYLKLADAYSPNAAIQTQEGDQKAEAAIPAYLETGKVFTVANHIPISTQLLSDLPTLERWVSGLLTYSCLLQLESQIIVGSSSLVTGLLETAPTVMTNTKTSKADKIGEAAATLATLGWNPNTVLLNPLDEFDIESEKATGGNEQYVSPPSGGGKFWKLNPVATPVIAQGTALVFDSSQATIFDRESINVVIGTVNDQFVRNMRTLLVEGRFGFAFAAASAIKRVSL